MNMNMNTESITLVKKTYKYKSYKDACNGNINTNKNINANTLTMPYTEYLCTPFHYTPKYVHMTMMLLPLKLSMSFLHPRDILNCIQTSKGLKKEIDTDVVWAAAVKSLSPDVVESINSTSNNNSNSNDDEDEDEDKDKEEDYFGVSLSYRTIALALARTKFDSRWDKPDYPKPLLRFKDVIVVIEFRVKIKKEAKKDDGTYSTSVTTKYVGVWSSDLTDFHHSESDDRDYTQHRIKYRSINDDATKNNRCLTIKKQLGRSRNENKTGVTDYSHLETSIRLIRRDTGQCFCASGFIEKDYTTDMNYDSMNFCSRAIRPMKLNKSASIARELFFFNEIISAQFQVNNVKIKQVPSGTCTSKTYKIDAFDFELGVSTDNDAGSDSWDAHHYKFEEADHVLLFLEALDWK